MEKAEFITWFGSKCINQKVQLNWHCVLNNNQLVGYRGKINRINWRVQVRKRTLSVSTVRVLTWTLQLILLIIPLCPTFWLMHVDPHLTLGHVTKYCLSKIFLLAQNKRCYRTPSKQMLSFFVFTEQCFKTWSHVQTLLRKKTANFYWTFTEELKDTPSKERKN